MKLSRRSLLAAGSITSAAIAVSARAVESQSSKITVFDSRLDRSRMFAATRRGRSIDVSQSSIRLWSALGTIRRDCSVSGFTRWSDFVAIRGQFESVGLRLSYCDQHDDLINWVME